MVRIVLAWAVVYGCALAAGAQAPPPLSETMLREWTDASGKRARAAFVRLEGDRIILRRADGKLVWASLAQLSEADRQYVASVPSPGAQRDGAKPASGELPGAPTERASSGTAAGAPPAAEDEPSTLESAVETVTDAVETIQELPRWLGPNQPDEGEAETRELVPAALVYLRVTRDFLEDYVERTVDRRKPVHDCVLGVPISGESHTRGKTRLTLLPSNEHVLANIVFEGTVHARTRGHRSPVVLHYVSDTTFQARKLIKLSDRALSVMPATIESPTRLQTTGIDTHLPRLRGRIARRIAWRRSAQAHGQAEAITADHTGDDVREDFDARVNRSMAKVQRVLASQIPDLEEGTRETPTDLRFRCRPEHVEMAILRENASAEERRLRPPPAKPGADFSLRVHRSLFMKAITDPELFSDLAPLFNQLLGARANQKGDANGNGKSGATSAAAGPGVKWVMESGWMVMDFQD